MIFEFQDGEQIHRIKWQAKKPFLSGDDKAEELFNTWREIWEENMEFWPMFVFANDCEVKYRDIEKHGMALLSWIYKTYGGDSFTITEGPVPSFKSDGPELAVY